MNFLAHSLLGFDDPALITGQFCGDFIRGSQLSHLPKRIEQGIRLHRYLDRFTDTDQMLLAVRDDMVDIPRRFAGIVIDVMFDHYLAQHWDQFSHQSLDAHAERVDQALQMHREVLPASLQRFMVILSREGILANNRELAAIELTLQRLSRRSDKFSALAVPMDQLEPLRERLHQPFVTFYPALHHAAIQFLDKQDHRSPK